MAEQSIRIGTALRQEGPARRSSTTERGFSLEESGPDAKRPIATVGGRAKPWLQRTRPARGLEQRLVESRGRAKLPRRAALPGPRRSHAGDRDARGVPPPVLPALASGGRPGDAALRPSSHVPGGPGSDAAGSQSVRGLHEGRGCRRRTASRHLERRQRERATGVRSGDANRRSTKLCRRSDVLADAFSVETRRGPP
jgi:hypothetical protein